MLGLHILFFRFNFALKKKVSSCLLSLKDRIPIYCWKDYKCLLVSTEKETIFKKSTTNLSVREFLVCTTVLADLKFNVLNHARSLVVRATHSNPELNR